MSLIIGVAAIALLVAAISLVDWLVNGRDRRQAQADSDERYRRFLGFIHAGQFHFDDADIFAYSIPLETEATRTGKTAKDRALERERAALEPIDPRD